PWSRNGHTLDPTGLTARSGSRSSDGCTSTITVSLGVAGLGLAGPPVPHSDQRPSRFPRTSPLRSVHLVELFDPRLDDVRGGGAPWAVCQQPSILASANFSCCPPNDQCSPGIAQDSSSPTSARTRSAISVSLIGRCSPLRVRSSSRSSSRQNWTAPGQSQPIT